MPRIPTIQNEVGARVAPPNSLMSAEAFGSQIGAATQQLGASLNSLGQSLAYMGEKQDKEREKKDLANARAGWDFGTDYLGLQKDLDTSAPDYAEKVGAAYDKKSQDYLNSIPDDRVRQTVATEMKVERQKYVTNATADQYKSQDVKARSQAGDAMTFQENIVRANPDAFDDSLTKYNGVIDAQTNIPPAQREEMKKLGAQRLAMKRFEGLIGSAKTEADWARIEGELGQDKWKQALDAKGYEHVSDVLGAAKGKEAETRIINLKNSLDPILNAVRADPNAYDKSVEAITKGIDSSNDLTAEQKEAVKTQYIREATTMRFTTLMEQAQTPEQIEAIQAEMNKPEWRDRFDSQKFSAQSANLNTEHGRMLAQVAAAKKEAAAQAKAAAASAISSVEDRVTKGYDVPDEEWSNVKTIVRQSGDTGTIIKFSDLEARRATRRQLQGLGPQQAAAVRDRYAGAQGVGAAGMPAPVAAAINDASAVTGISSSFLSALARKEYGKHLQSGDYGKGNDWGGSSAIGVFQFTEGTARATLDSPAARALGIDVRGKSDEQIHAMFKDPKVAAIGAALLTRQNANALQAALGRAPSDAELYMAHFLGAGGAIPFLKAMETNPDQAAALVVPKAAAANRSIFYGNGPGSGALTVRAVYNRLTNGFGTDPTRIAAVRAEEADRVIKEMQQGLKDDPMDYVARTGRFQVPALDSPENIQARGQLFNTIASSYNIPTSELKPLTKEEANSYGETIKNGTSEEVMGLISQLQGMGSVAARAAYKQLGEADPVFEYAAGLAHDAGGTDAARDVLRGRKQLEENKSVRDVIGAEPQQVSQEFNSIAGRALVGVNPRVAGAIFEAAKAHYVETYALRNGGEGGFNKDAFTASVNAVMGGRNKIGNVNGEPTVMPKGVDPDTFDAAVDKMTTDDYVALSRDGRPPRFANGDIIEADEIAREGKFRAIGGDQYRIEMADGQFAVTGTNQRGGVDYYIFQADASAIQRAAQRKAVAGFTSDKDVKAQSGAIRGGIAAPYQTRSN